MTSVSYTKIILRILTVSYAVCLDRWAAARSGTNVNIERYVVELVRLLSTSSGRNICYMKVDFPYEFDDEISLLGAVFLAQFRSQVPCVWQV
jgi:hypothetical protein